LRTRRAKTGVELRDGQSFALAGLLDNSETKSFSKIPVVSDIPVIGSIFKSKSFQKQETELMFIVTAQLVKPVNRDDLPQMKGVDGLKSGSPLGLEPKGEEIQGRTGFSVTGQNNTEKPAEAPKATEPVKAGEPAVDQKSKSATESTGSSTTSTNTTNLNQPLPPVALTKPVVEGTQPIKP
jgi:pilus assembly protein CpaC